MPHFLAELPDNIRRELMEGWLDMRNLRNLMIASTETAARRAIVMTKQEILDSKESIAPVSVSELQWFLQQATEGNKLSSLNLEMITNKWTTDALIESLTETLKTLPKFSRLRELKCGYVESPARTENVAFFIMDLPQLEKISISGKISNGLISLAFSKAENIREVNIQSYNDLSSSIVTLAKHNHRLNAITTTVPLSDDSLTELSLHTTELKVIDSRNCGYHDTGKGLIDLVKSNSQLEILRLPTGIIGTSLAKLAEYTTNLTELDAQWCFENINYGIVAIVQHNSGLKKISFNNSVDDETLGRLADHTAKLEEVNLATSNDCTGQGIVALAKKNTGLRIVQLPDSITDGSLKMIGEHIHHLQKVTIVNYNVHSFATMEGIEALVRGNPNLTELAIAGIDTVNFEDMQKLHQQFPRLAIEYQQSRESKDVKVIPAIPHSQVAGGNLVEKEPLQKSSGMEIRK